MKRLILIAVTYLILGASLAHAQNAVVTQSYPLTISPNAANITTTGTFQTVFPASTNQTGRVDCIIQNLSSRPMYLYFSTPTGVPTSDALNLSSGSFFRCNNGGIVIRNQISITGTSGDRYFFAQ